MSKSSSRKATAHENPTAAPPAARKSNRPGFHRDKEDDEDLASPMPPEKSAEDRERELATASRHPKVFEVARQMAGGSDAGSSATHSFSAIETFQQPFYEVGSTYEIPVLKLVANPQNARKLPQPGHKLDELARSLSVQQHVAANGFVTPEGEVMLIDGHRRHAAAKSVGLKTLRVEIRPAPENNRELYLASRAANLEREPQGILDDALMFKQLLEQGVFENQLVLSEALGIEKGELSRILALNKLSLKVMQYINEHPSLVNLHMLNSLRQYQELAGEEETRLLVDRIIRDGISAREVERLRKAFGQERPTRVRSDTKALYKFGKGKATVRQFETTRKLVLEVGEVAQGVSLEHLSEVLRKALQAVMGEEGAE